LRLRLGDWNLGIENLRLGNGIEDFDWAFKLGIGIWNWGFGIKIEDWGLGIED